MATSTPPEDELVAINVTPLVDITLVLLIIFMVTASFIVRETVEFDLPRAAPAEQRVQALVNVVIDDGLRIYFDGVLVDEKGLEASLDSALAKDRDTRAIVTADHRLDYGRVMHLIDVVKGRGIEKLALNLQLP